MVLMESHKKNLWFLRSGRNRNYCTSQKWRIRDVLRFSISGIKKLTPMSIVKIKMCRLLKRIITNKNLTPYNRYERVNSRRYHGRSNDPFCVLRYIGKKLYFAYLLNPVSVNKARPSTKTVNVGA
jgi:hypothetical protein